MIEIFIPVIWICINNTCMFMQEQNYYIDEAKCLIGLNQLENHMRNLVKDAGKDGAIQLLEGTCVDASIKTRIVTPTGVKE